MNEMVRPHDRDLCGNLSADFRINLVFHILEGAWLAARSLAD
jgi:hypothetical protein